METPGWKGSWFIGVNGGVNAFIGSPLGCGDIWGRMKPHFGINAGKWYTPTVGSRLSFSGFSIKNGEIKNQNYWSASADMLWNISNVIYGKGDTRKFSLVPYVGFGIIHNKQARTSPFALSYGVMAQYGLPSRLEEHICCLFRLDLHILLDEPDSEKLSMPSPSCLTMPNYGKPAASYTKQTPVGRIRTPAMLVLLPN